MTLIHHVDYWLADPANELPAWRWLLSQVGLACLSRWEDGETWGEAGGAYLTLTASPNTTSSAHDRRRPGVNHIAFVVGDARRVDRLMAEAPGAGWRPLYQERYPHAGGPQHYAGWLENTAGYKVELVSVEGAGEPARDRTT